MTAISEGTDQTGNPYRCTYALKYWIKDLSQHPVDSGEWLGEPLPDQMCFNAGLAAGCVSTAAGRYQIIHPTWKRVSGILSLHNFGAEAQDDAAIQLIKEAGALDLVNSGQIAEAIPKCREIWASLPGNSAGQPQTSFANLMTAYTDAGGGFA
jgi:lysozyme